MFTIVEIASPQQFRIQVADFLMDKIQAVLRDHGTCSIGLSGGMTPRAVYEKLGGGHSALRGSSRCRALDAEAGPRTGGWEKVCVFLVDERYVPPDHPESNQRLVRETPFRSLHIPEEHLIFPNTALPIDDCMADYTRRLKALWEDRLPDLIVLGMGTDGHIASLFPPLSDLALGDECLVLHTQTELHPIRDRITLSLNTLCAANEQVLLLKGVEKRRTWEEMMASSEDERRWPLKRIMETGKLTVFRCA